MGQGEARTKQLIRAVYRRQIVIGLLLMALTLGSFALIGVLVRQEASNAEIINLAGRQRMLTQRIVLHANRYLTAVNREHRATSRLIAVAALDEFERGHERLVREASQDEANAELRALYFGPSGSLESDSRRFSSAARQLVEMTSDDASQLQGRGDLILRMADSTLILPLERATRLFQQDTERYSTTVFRLALLSALLTFSFIVIAFRRIFRPMMRQLRADVAARDEAEAALRESEEVKRSVVAAAMDAIVAIDPYGRVVEFNSSAEAIFGFRREDVIGKPIADFIIPERFRKEHAAGLQRNLAGGASKVIEKRLEMPAVNAAGQEFTIELSITHTSGNRLYVAFIRDLTERKRAEQALQRVQKMQALGQLTGGIAHDFNNLLAIIVGNLELARRGLDADSPVARRLDTALKTTERGVDLTRRLLLFSRQEAAPRAQTSVQINELLDGMLDMLGRTLTHKVEIRAELAAELWAVSIHPGEFEDCLVNLAINARDAMPNGGRLSIRTQNLPAYEAAGHIADDLPAGDWVLLTVSDNGAGIRRDVIPHIFEPFFTTKPRGKGTGLGLAMVYATITRAGGTIRVYSEPGRGTSFRLYFPRAASTVAASAACQPQREAMRGTETILVVDDEPLLLEVAKSYLGACGYRVLTASSGAEAWERIEGSGDIDLVLSDVVMPGKIDGVDLARRLLDREDGPGIILATGFVCLEEIDGADERLNTLIHDALAKPYAEAQLVQRVRAVLDARRPQRVQAALS